MTYCTANLILFLFISLSLSFCVPTEERIKHIINGPHGAVTCFEPPPAVAAKAGTFDVDRAVKEVRQIIKDPMGPRNDYLRFRDIASNAEAFDLIEFRICTAYASGLFTRIEYAKFLELQSGSPRGERRE